MGPQEDYIETVFTCEGDINDPNLHSRLEDFQSRLKELLSTDKRKLILKKVEPWNSVRVTFNIPREAALRLKQLAQQGNATLRQLGVLAVQIEGDQLISLTIAGRNNERTQLIFRTADTVDAPNLSLIDSGGTSDYGSPGPNNVQTTSKNIADYLRQGTSKHVFESIFPPDGGAVQGVSSGRIPNQNLLGQGSSFHSDKNIPRPTSHIASSGQSKVPTGHSFPNEFDPNSIGMDKPPPPYPEGSAWFNNVHVAKGIRGIPRTTSPLLVNLLQTEPSLAFSMNNLINSKMLPPSAELSPPLKKKRKPRKPKDKTVCEGEATIQSVPNPVLSSYSMPTSGSSSSILPVPMVTQALAANTQPSVTFSKSVPSTAEMLFSSSVAEEHDRLLLATDSKALSKVSKVNDTLQLSQESTAGKIINPYTGLLEPMEHSESNPAKNCIPYDRLSPQGTGLKNSEQNMLSKERLNHVFSHTKLPSITVSSVPTLCSNSSTSNFSLQQSQTKSTQDIGSRIQGSDALSVSNLSSSALISSRSHDLVQSSPSVSKHSEMFFDPSRKIQHYVQTCVTGNVAPSKEIYKNAVVHGFHKSVSTTVSSDPLMNTAESTYLLQKQLIKDQLKMNSSENLLNPQKNPAKTTGSFSEHSIGVGSDNSSQTRLIHDTHMQNDVGAVTTGCTVETNSKVYYNDSGVGSSSERSDDTPSEPGDSDFKSGHNHIDEFTKAVFHESLAQKQNLLKKSDQQVLTVGYAMSNQPQNEHFCNDVSNILAVDKALSHPALTKRNSDLSKLNSENMTDHQVAMMHLFNKNKKKSPKHFVNEETIGSLSKEHMKLLKKVDSMQYVKDFAVHGGMFENSNQHGSPSTRLAIPGRVEKQHSPSHPSARTPSPRMMANHDTKDASDISLCNKIRHSAGNTPVSEIESLHNDLTSKLMEHNFSAFLSQKKGERKTKSPVSGMNLTVSAAMELISLENMMSVSVNSALGKHGESIAGQGTLKNDINNIKRTDNLGENSDCVKVSKSGAYKRRSPAAAMLNPLPQQFFDPRKLTESVQKLVKPIFSESASLPHSQRRSPGSVGTKACTSPQSHKGDGYKDSLDNSENVINGPLESDPVVNSDSHSFSSDILINSDSVKLESENTRKHLNSSNFNHVLNDKYTNLNDLQNDHNHVLSSSANDNNSVGYKNHSIDSQESAFSNISVVSADSNPSSNSLVSTNEANHKYSEYMEKKPFSAFSSSENNIHKQTESENAKVPIEVSSGANTNSETVGSKNENSKVPTNNISSTVHQGNSEIDKNSGKTNVKISTKKSENLCNTIGADYSSLKVNCDQEKTSPKSSQKSPNLSPVKKGKSEEIRPIKLHLSHGVFTNPQPFSKEELANETNITVITRSDPRKTENSTGEPTVPPLVLKVSRKTPVVETPTEQKHEESQSLTMSLRARKASEASESSHNLRPPKPVRQKSLEQEVEQYKIMEDPSNKTVRQSRRRKTTTENETEPEKRAHIENYLQESDEKSGKTEESPTELNENLTLFDTVKSGLRARTQNKPEDKSKVSPKDLKHSKSVEDDVSLKRNSQSKRNRQSPSLEKQQTKEPRDKSPGRISRTRSGQISPNAEDDGSKRSTRSAKPKNQIGDTQNDATDTLPPANKRRRTTSRDHR